MILKYEVKRTLRVHLQEAHNSLTLGTRAMSYSQCTSLGSVIRVAHPINPNRKLCLFTTSHSVKVYTKWKQARPSERQQVIHTLCPCYLKESLLTLMGPAGRGDSSHHHLERRNPTCVPGTSALKSPRVALLWRSHPWRTHRLDGKSLLPTAGRNSM